MVCNKYINSLNFFYRRYIGMGSHKVPNNDFYATQQSVECNEALAFSNKLVIFTAFGIPVGVVSFSKC